MTRHGSRFLLYRGGKIQKENVKMRLIAFGPRFLGLRWGVSLGRRDFEKIFARGAKANNPDTGSFLYVVRGDHNRVKIGITANPNARLAQLQTGSAFPLEFAWIGAPQGQAIGIEYDAHEMLANYRSSGEWFEVAPDAAVGAICASAQRRGMNILSCTPELAERIRQTGAAQDAKQSTLKAWHKVAFIILGIIAVVMVLLIIIGNNSH